MAQEIKDPAEPAAPKPELLLENWRNELDSADLYQYLARREPDQQRAALMVEMADAEIRHAEVMRSGLEEQGVRVPAFRVSFKTRLLKLLARAGGPRLIYPLLHGSEIEGTADYAAQDSKTAALAGEERSHARTLGEMSRTAVTTGERWHRTAGGGTLRAAVFGVNDGLVSNLSLIMGFAGASADAKFVLLAGLSGLLAGASSMAAGEYVSMKAQRELLERQIELEAAELAVSPEEEVAELALIYRAKGLNKEEAERLANRLTEDPSVALDTLVREELGLDPKELGNPIAAAVSSFLAFAGGAILPVIPFFFGASTPLIIASIAVSGAALFSVGALLSLFTGRGTLFSGGRQLMIGAVAATITFGLGSLIGASTGV
ncbi:MAG TPA: VIT1/CCC1 transporter family protein [Dehalococcoidia bacterium]|nr:VIT1/CCC1 transporter family protein [Dehalococcoidia bacterium]